MHVKQQLLDLIEVTAVGVRQCFYHLSLFGREDVALVVTDLSGKYLRALMRVSNLLMNI